MCKASTSLPSFLVLPSCPDEASKGLRTCCSLSLECFSFRHGWGYLFIQLFTSSLPPSSSPTHTHTQHGKLPSPACKDLIVVLLSTVTPVSRIVPDTQSALNTNLLNSQMNVFIRGALSRYRWTRMEEAVMMGETLQSLWCSPGQTRTRWPHPTTGEAITVCPGWGGVLPFSQAPWRQQSAQSLTRCLEATSERMGHLSSHPSSEQDQTSSHCSHKALSVLSLALYRPPRAWPPAQKHCIILSYQSQDTAGASENHASVPACRGRHFEFHSQG